MYFGEHQVSFDEKGRMTLPKRFRSLSEGLGHIVWYMTRGFDKTISLYHRDEWMKIQGQVSAYSSMNTKAIDFKRLLLASVAEGKLDDLGRMIVPPYLRDMAGIDKEAILIGVGDHLELWSRDAWRDFQRQGDTGFKEMAAQLFADVAMAAPQHAEGAVHA